MDFSIDDLMDPYTPKKGTKNTVINGITTKLSFGNIDQHFPSVKNSNQSQYSKYFPDNSIDFEGMKLMSIFDHRSLKNITLKYTPIHECYNFNCVQSNIYLKIPSIYNNTTTKNVRNTIYEAYVP